MKQQEAPVANLSLRVNNDTAIECYSFPSYPMTVMVLARSSLNSVGIHQNVSRSTLEIQEAECCGHWMWSN